MDLPCYRFLFPGYGSFAHSPAIFALLSLILGFSWQFLYVSLDLKCLLPRVYLSIYFSAAMKK